jgi:hypothetical protein
MRERSIISEMSNNFFAQRQKSDFFIFKVKIIKNSVVFLVGLTGQKHGQKYNEILFQIYHYKLFKISISIRVSQTGVVIGTMGYAASSSY